MRIEKRLSEGHATPNLSDYDQECASFSWAEARGELDGLSGDRGLNLAYEAIGRHVAKGHGDQTAIIWLGKKGERVEISYAELDSLSNKFANVLANLGVEPGDRVYSLAGRIPELYVCALGTLKHRAVFCPLFSAFGPEPIAERLNLGEARVLFTTERLNRRRIAGIRERIRTLEHVIVVADPKKPKKPEDTVDWFDAMAQATADYEIADTDPEMSALLHFTSGTTGTPKGAYHAHQAVLTHYMTGKLALDLHPGDIYWCTADPGWGDRDLVRDQRSAQQPRHNGHRRSRVRPQALVPDSRRGEGAGLVHGADGDSNADEDRTGASAEQRPLSAPVHGQCGGALESAGGRLGLRGVRQALPRQLVADGNRRDHDLELRPRWT